MSVYDKTSLLDNRYQLLATSSIYTYEDENLTSYAEFLRKFGRYIGKDGYVDAQQAIHRANLKQQKMEKKYKSYSDTGDSKVKINFTSTDIASMNPERTKVNEKHLKVIEDQMIQSKQEERAFKRTEGDVKKEQRQIRQAVREFDQLNTKKRFSADKSLSKNLEVKKVLEIENAHKKENKTKDRTEQNIEMIVSTKDKGRKTLLVCNDLSRQYKLKMSELDIKKKRTQHSTRRLRIQNSPQRRRRIPR